jgi:bifunctional pyridoxal-dependent enzyme with beta-cystathionase and maltose regulon repressor activities
MQTTARTANGIFCGVDYVTQIAMKAALEKCYYWVDAFREHLEGNRDYVYRRLSALPGLKAVRQEATFVSFPDISSFGLSSAAFQEFMLNEQKLALVPGTVKWFGPGAEGHVRLCYATSRAILSEAMDRFEEGIHKLENGEEAVRKGGAHG